MLELPSNRGLQSAIVLGFASFGLLAGPVAAQQFQEQQASRFPQPAHTSYSNQLSIADVDNDGALDVAFANGCCFNTQGSAQRSHLYMNDGNGFFSDESSTRLQGLSGWFRGVEFGDVNSNGYLDSIWASDFNQLPRLLMNKGDDDPGFFVNETATRLPNITSSSARAQFADFNNDGHLDIFLVNGGSVWRFGTGLSRMYYNDGDGFFTDASANLPQVAVTGPMDAKIGDVNNNFNLDVRIGALNNNQSKLFVNNGDGTFTNASASVPNDGSCYSYDMADINGNGNLDMFGINAVPGNSINLLIRNNGDGTWTNISNQISNNINNDDNDSKFIDYNNNGHMDLVIAAIFPSQGERLYQNDGNGNFTIVNGAIQLVSSATLDIGVGDMDGDGRLDIICASGESGNFINKIYMNVSGPQDTIPPNIVRTEQHDDTEDTDGPYVVRTFITDSHTADRNFFDKGIFLNYSHNEGPVQQAPMKWVGGTIYRGEIPGLSPGEVEYFVTAIDFNDNLGTGDTLSFTIEGEVEPKCAFADLTCDGSVNVFDLLELLAAWGDCDDCEDCPADLDESCAVNVFDLLELLSNWG